MKRILLFCGGLLVLTALILAIVHVPAGRALPEYSAQTGEPCATCHVSPSGGGPRGPRGLAWVASNKPSAVPDLVQSLQLLGVELTADPSDFKASDAQVPEAGKLEVQPWQGKPLYQWLNDYDGN
jgi:hypothetical protein